MLKIIKSGANGLTGHIEVVAHIVEQTGDGQTIDGAPETHGIAAHELREKFNGDPREWLRGVHRTMLHQHEARKISTTALKALQGITIFEDEDNINGNRHQAPRP